MKKSRLYVGITLIVQAISFLVMFMILAAKKKSIAAAFLAVATMEGAAGGYLLWEYSKEEKEYEDSFGEDFLTDEDMDLDEDALSAGLFGDDEEEKIPTDTEASEADFQ